MAFFNIEKFDAIRITSHKPNTHDVINGKWRYLIGWKQLVSIIKERYRKPFYVATASLVCGFKALNQSIDEEEDPYSDRTYTVFDLIT